MNGLVGTLTALISSIVSVTGSVPAPKVATATCQPVGWASGPVVEGSMFKGTAFIQCDYDGVGGGGLPELETYLIERMKRQATQIYAGPLYSQQEGMPSTGYDFSMGLPFQGETVTIREDGWVATDSQSKLACVMNSKGITATGNGQYLKKFDMRIDVTSLPTAGKFRARLSAAVQIQKPGLIPVNMFKTQVQQGVESAVNDYRDGLIKELEDNT